MSLDPLANRLAKEEEAAKKIPKPILNPEFPYRATEFDPAYFAVDEDPPAVDKNKEG